MIRRVRDLSASRLHRARMLEYGTNLPVMMEPHIQQWSPACVMLVEPRSKSGSLLFARPSIALSPPSAEMVDSPRPMSRGVSSRCEDVDNVIVKLRR